MASVFRTSSPPNKPNSLLSNRLFLPLILTTVIIILISPLAFQPFSTFVRRAPSLSTIRYDKPLCHVIGNPDTEDVWQENSQTVCRFDQLCLSRPSRPLVLDTTPSHCQLSNPLYHPLSAQRLPTNFSNCEQLAHKMVVCALGPGLIRENPSCPTVRPMDDYSEQSTWLPGVSIVVPEYPYPKNIYHFANVVAQIAHVTDHLATLLPDQNVSTLNLVMHGAENKQQWQSSLFELTLRRRIKSKYPNTKVHYMSESKEHLCMKNAIVMGRRGHVNVWPFANSTFVPTDGYSIPADAVRFKRAVFDEVGIKCELPSGASGKSCLPPKRVGYARRSSGSMRSFPDQDEKWFVSMLEEECTRAGFELKSFMTKAEQPLEDQVRTFAEVGLVVGIHGANLVNSLFMRPFSGLLEVFPTEAVNRCYYAGSNSGLRYFAHESSTRASAEESGCPENNRCREQLRHRKVKLGAQDDRNTIQAYVREGIEHIEKLHARFGEGVEVRLDEDSGFYRIVG